MLMICSGPTKGFCSRVGADSLVHSQPAVCSLSTYILGQLLEIKLNKIFKNQILAALEEMVFISVPQLLKLSPQHRNVLILYQE